MLRNMPAKEVFNLRNMCMYEPKRSVTKTLLDSQDITMTVHSLWRDTHLQDKESDKDIFITCLDGAMIVSLSKEDTYILRTGESLMISSESTYSLTAKENCKFVMMYMN